jgi:hypothetical protein
MTLVMPRKLPPFVECWRDRRKILRVYFRKGKGPRVPLPDHIGSDDFNAAYQAALEGQIAAKRERREPDRPGTIAALIRSYLRSAAYVGLRATTKTGYSSRIEMLRTQHGHRTISGMTRAGIVTQMIPSKVANPTKATLWHYKHQFCRINSKRRLGLWKRFRLLHGN